ncbi:hypothetical protein SK128_018012 [Halocaridina rubra]|uniref:Uncharacterized protein n=1 Tax=Halocaridina rubra TaxID=373956 RepID=A0AAN8ZY76_HALRR
METQSRIGLFAITAALLQALLFFIYIGFVRYDTFYDGTIWNQTKQQGHDTPTLRDYYPIHVNN